MSLVTGILPTGSTQCAAQKGGMRIDLLLQSVVLAAPLALCGVVHAQAVRGVAAGGAAMSGAAMGSMGAFGATSPGGLGIATTPDPEHERLGLRAP